MSPTFPPRLSKRATVALAVVALVTFLYTIVVSGQILLWFVLVGLAIGLYLTYLLIVALFRLVGAVERIATAAEADSGIRTSTEAGNPAPPGDDDASTDTRSGTRGAETDADGAVPDEDAASPDDAPPDEQPGSDDLDDAPPDEQPGSDDLDDAPPDEQPGSDDPDDRPDGS